MIIFACAQQLTSDQLKLTLRLNQKIKQNG